MDTQATEQELQSFLLDEKSNMKEVPQNNKHKPSKNLEKSEAAHLNGLDYFDPFDRNLEHPTTDGETLTHLLKASLGTGILAMPQAFMCTGLILGIFSTVFVSAVCTFCSYLLVKCAHTLYRRTKVSSMSYADVAEVAFANGPPWSRRFSSHTRQIVLWLLFVTYFGTCSVYAVIIATNFHQLFVYHMAPYNPDLRIFIAALLVPLILLSYVPNLKYLAPVSMIANLLMAGGLGITFYYLLCDMPRITDRPAVASLESFPTFFCLTVFAMEAIGVVMPLENNMKTPKHFLGFFGVLNMGMGGVTIVYILLGFLGYLKYGEYTQASITLNLPTEDLAAQLAKIFISLAVFCTYGLQFFVCLEIAWDKIKNSYEKATTFHNYVLRTVLVALSVALAVAVPSIGPFIGLIGAFCFSLLGIMAPVIIEFATYWENVTVWMTIRNIALIIIGCLALVFGTASSINEIIGTSLAAQVVPAEANTTTLVSAVSAVAAQ